MTLLRPPTRLLRLAPLLVLLAACGGSNPSELEVACGQVDCGEGGRCVLDGSRAACLCGTGFQAEGLRCTPVATPAANPCEPSPCTDPLRRECSVSAGAAVCSCPAGWAPLGTTTCEAERAFDCEATAPAGTGDAAEPDPCPTRARTLVFDREPEARTLAPEGDVDWMLLPTTQGRTYEVRAESPDALALALEVRSADGLRVVAADRLGRATATVRFRADAAGHTLRVRTLAGSGTGAYRVGLSDLGVDDHGDAPATATALAVGATLQGTLFTGDADVFAVPLPGGRTFEVQAVGSGDAAASLVLELLGEGGVLVRRQTGSIALLRPLVRVGGTYHLRVSSSTGQALEYTLGTRDLGADDHGDLPAEGTPLSGTATGTLGSAGDLDVFTFPSAAGQVHRVACSTQAFVCRLRVRGPTGTLLRERTSEYSSYATELYVEAPVAGLLSVEVATNTTAVGAYSLTYEALGLDDHGDTLASATAQGFGGPQRAVLEAHGDVDVFSFGAQAGRVYRVRCGAADGAYTAVCRVQLRSAAGAVLKAASGTQLGYEAPADATLYAEVVPAETWSRGAYTLTLEDAGPDDHGDSVEAATLVTPGAVTAAAFESFEDVDVLAFDAQAGRVYHVRCTVQSASGCQARLRGADGTLLASASVYGAFNGTLLLTHEATATERLTVELSIHAFDTSAAPWGTYSFQLLDLGPDDHGDGVDDGTALQAGDSGTGRIDTDTDVDVFSFTVAPGRVYRFTCQQTSAGSYTVCPVSLRDAADGLLLGQREDGVVALEAGDTAVAVRALVARTYSSGLFSYAYRLDDVGTDDHGDTHATATPHAVGTTPLQARMETPADVDVFAVPVAAGRIYTVSATFGSVALPAAFHDAAGTSLGNEAETAEAGTLYVRVSASGAMGTYTLRVLDAGVDDHADTAAGATRLQLGVSAAGVLETSADRDVFVVTLAAGTTYRLSAPTGTVRASVRSPGGGVALLSDYTAWSGRTFQASAAGDYTLEVQRYWYEREYTLLLEAQ